MAKKTKKQPVGIHKDAAGNVTISAPVAVAVVNPDQLQHSPRKSEDLSP